MSTPVKAPHVIAGTPRSSGDVQTGEIPFTRGGGRTATVYSGAIAMGVTAAPGALVSGGSILVFSGAGRLNSFTALWPAGVALAGNGENACVSGQPIVAYDAATLAGSGLHTDGKIATLGAKILFSWCPPKQLASGVTNESFAQRYLPQPLDVPFQSGLCVLAMSGSPGFTVTFTPEVAPYVNQGG
jgi:hypothetical protein